MLKTINYKIVVGKNEDSFRGYDVNVDPIFEIFQEDSEHPANSFVHIAFKVNSKKSLRILRKGFNIRRKRKWSSGTSYTLL